ncbi:unnamed protein product [Miscanthus lutarioriparius]|uniref:DUF7595 domain-containing protein n=1 Tax=Miscanthus lutarioriparius TaxID=422564 RepID=A0A811N5L5_9POAL|nr:unnamed protein product [Miscanthus lutarioriparius]
MGITTYTGAGGEKTDVYMVDTTTAADATRLVKATFAEADETLRNVVPLESRGGLVLVRNNTHHQRQLLVCNLATRRCLALPPEPAFPDSVWSTGSVTYVLLVGSSDGEGAGADAAVGRPFQVLKAKLVLSQYCSYRRLLMHTFSSEHGAWSPLTDIPTPNLHGSGNRSSHLRPLVIGDVVHWLCLTDSGSYILMLHVGAARVKVTSLPASFPRDSKNNHPYNDHRYLLATASAGGNPVVLVADTDKISAWEQSNHTKMWKSRPQVVIENETILGFKDGGLAELIEKERRWWNRKHVPELLWFDSPLSTTYEGGRGKTTVYLVDTTAADTTRLVEATFASAAAETKTLTGPLPVDSRSGLVLIRATATTSPPWQQRHDQHQLLVCNPTTGRRLALPSELDFPPHISYNPEQYVLLVGDGYDGEVGDGAGAAVDRPFQVLKAKLALSNSNRRLMVHTFSSEHGAWSPFMEIPTPNIHGRCMCRISLQKVLVVGDVVHWLCLTDVGSYVLMLHVRVARVGPAASDTDERPDPGGGMEASRLGGGGRDKRAVRPRGGRRRHKAAACLPLDVIVEIAARSDAATLVRCAATCRGSRRRVAEDPNLRARLRLRDTGRFLLPLLRGHLAGMDTHDDDGNEKTDLYLVATTAADTTRLVRATFAETETLRRDAVPVDSRGGLVLVRATATSQAHPWQRQHDQLLVCNPATRRRQDLPPEPAFPPHAGQSTEVKNPYYRRLMVHTFSSEHGAWSPLTEIPTPNIHGRYICWASRRNVLVVGDVVHWLYLTDVGSYVLMLHVRAARVSETALPASFPRGDAPGRRSYLLATDSAGGSPVVLVADAENKNIRAWEQCKRTKTKLWKARPQVVIEREAILGFNDEVKEAVLRCNDDMVKIFGREGGTRRTRTMCGPELLWFGERSGAVLLETHGCCLLWMGLHPKKIVRCFSSERRLSYKVYCPCEVDLSSWVPTFSSAVTI